MNNNTVDITDIKNKIDDIILLLTNTCDGRSASFFVSKHKETPHINKFLITKYNISHTTLKKDESALNYNGSIEVDDKDLIERIKNGFKNENDFKLFLNLNKDTTECDRIVKLSKRNNLSEKQKKIINKVYYNEVIKNDIEDLDNKLNTINSNINNNKENKVKILDNIEKIKLFEEITNTSINELNLLYRMTRDGKKLGEIQKNIYCHSNIIILIKTYGNKIFGGYTSCKIDYNNRPKKGEDDYLFSLDLKQKFTLKGCANYSIFDYEQCGIQFGNGELTLFDNVHGNYLIIGNNQTKCYNTQNISIESFCGKDDGYFEPSEIEVFEINRRGY